MIGPMSLSYRSIIDTTFIIHLSQHITLTIMKKKDEKFIDILTR